MKSNVKEQLAVTVSPNSFIPVTLAIEWFQLGGEVRIVDGDLRNMFDVEEPTFSIWRGRNVCW